MKQILSLVLAASFATSGFANYASLLPQYPVVKDCYADKYQLSLVPAEQKRVALQLLATNVPTAEQKVSSGKSVRLFGPEGVISGLNKTQTALGHAALVGMLANSTKQQAQARQNSVRLLAQNSQLADELATHLK